MFFLFFFTPKLIYIIEDQNRKNSYKESSYGSQKHNQPAHRIGFTFCLIGFADHKFLWQYFFSINLGFLIF
ncbi:MAG: hypothetical protein C0593_02950 [Marinilabiliales bacterium]|nr:MAG: hypothetical protein C0593_02950 [Marinilabiliales bacterium]